MHTVNSAAVVRNRHVTPSTAARAEKNMLLISSSVSGFEQSVVVCEPVGSSVSFIVGVFPLSDAAVFVVGGFIVEPDVSVGGMNNN